MLQTIGWLAAAALVASGFALGVGLSAASAAETLPKLDLLNVYPVPGDITAVEVDFIDTTNGETGYEIFARVPTTDGSINVSSTMIPGGVSGTENIGRGVIKHLKPGTRYCFSVRSYRLGGGYDWSPRSNEICYTLPAATAPQAPAFAFPVIREGAQGEVVTSLQYLLREHSIGAFVDGTFSSQTWQALIVTLREGSQGEAVIAVQRQLASRGAAIFIDGDFGGQTADAVRAYQQAKGLTADGIVGPQTLQALPSGR